MSRRDGFTRGEVVALAVTGVFLAVLLIGMCVPALTTPPRWVHLQTRCMYNLSQLGKGAAAYLNDYGDNRWWPFPLGRGSDQDDFNGAEWLATLYWTRILPEPDVFLCPVSGDTNHEGRDLGTCRAVPGRFGSPTVSYAAVHYRSGHLDTVVPAAPHRSTPPAWQHRTYYVLTDSSGRPLPAAVADDVPPNLPLASDDTHGTINHGRYIDRGMGFGVVYFDTHCGGFSSEDMDLANSVGRKDGLLWWLRN